MKNRIKEKIKEALIMLQIDLPEEGVFVEETKDISKGDFSTNIAMRLASVEKTDPLILAERIVKSLKKDKDFKLIEFVKPGFINFFLSDTYLLGEIEKYAKLGADYFAQNIQKGRNIAIEFTDANPFKIFHIGHLYTNAVGESISRMQESLGASVKRVTYQGDVGLHVSKTMWGVEEQLKKEGKNFSDIEKLDLEERVAWLGSCYILGAEMYDYSKESKAIEEINEINYYIYYLTNPSLEKKDFSKFEEVNIKEKYTKGRLWCLEYFEKIYSVLGTKFDNYFFESEVSEMGLEIVKKNTGEIFKKDAGSVIYEGEKEKGLHTRVFINKYGLPTYETKEIGLALKKEELLRSDESIIITANEQSSYFKVIMDVLSKLNPEIAYKTKHFSHGVIRLPNAQKMSSRRGGVISGEWLFSETKRKVLSIMSNSDELEPELVDEISDKIAIAAIKYAFLKVTIGSDIVFDFDKAISFDGDTGPYIQYVYARANSLIKEFGTGDSQNICLGSCLANPFVERLVRTLSKYRVAMLDSALTYSPSTLCQYLFDLSQSFNAFYQNVRLSEMSEDDRGVYLVIIRAVLNVLQSGLFNLGIPIVEKM
ncbi:arginine--tRNA ligase [Candidatus Dojkabacteria bacterium]|uniref:Arginine--tRNA ligase n=1 Tax=Candidatus Dojkabacteria bacterium TaxID=2099670 RepID=A0A847D042_9BACT|nr:arginine--tRNA ligase [Candidatus Dojkabacteria bacterium]